MSLVLDFYGLREQPFGVSPNLRFYYESTPHREAYDALKLGIEENDGLTVLIAEAGAGKTTLLLTLADHYRDKASVAVISAPQWDGESLLRLIAAEFNIVEANAERDSLRLQQLIARLVQDPLRTKAIILMVDEAQNLSDSALEMVRLLSNLESTDHRHMHIVLAGQPSLETTLHDASHVMQRVTTLCRLERMNTAQVGEYLQCRLKTAGYAGPRLFTEEAVSKISLASFGIPRIVNRLAMQALQLGQRLGQKEITAAIVDTVASDLNRSIGHNTAPTMSQPAIAAKDSHEASAVDYVVPDLLPDYATAMDSGGSSLDPAVDLSLADEVIDSVLSSMESAVTAGKPPETKSVATDALEMPAASTGSRVSFAANDPKLGLFLDKLEAEAATSSAGSGEASMQERETVEEPHIAEPAAPAYRPQARPKSPPVQKGVPPVNPAKNSPSAEPDSSDGLKVDSRVAQIFARRPSRYPRPLAEGSAMPKPILEPEPAPQAPSMELAQAPQPVPIVLPPTPSPDSTTVPALSEGESPRSIVVKALLIVLLVAGLALLALFAYTGSFHLPEIGSKKVAQRPVLLPPRPPVVEEKTEPEPPKPATEAKAVKKSKPVLIKLVRPVFPSEARQQHVYGNVTIEVYVDKAGTVERTQVLNGNPLLAKAAVAAVQKWKYLPSRQNGAAVPGEERVVVTFDEKQ